ncbi:MAG: BamA/TamA family outer membrane protein, partial [Aquificae bacterium]|nr:BamA/TamA family outer membrane protein [Aquificota bacterium]
DIQITGNYSFWRREIIAITGLVEGYPVELKLLHNVYTRLKKFYMDNGFPFVQVYLHSRIDKKGNVSVQIEIDEGKEVEVGDVIIRFSRPVSDKLKEEAVKHSGIKKGSLFRLSEITSSIDRIQQFLYKKGFYDAFVNVVSFRPDGDEMDVVVYAELGIKYRIHFSGNKAFSEEELKKLLTFEENGFNYYQLVQSTERIEKFYRERGYLDARVIPSFVEDFKKLTTDIYFTVVEGSPYTLKKAVVETDVEKVKRFFKKLEGKVYKPVEIKKFLQKTVDSLYNKGYLNASYSLNEKVDREDKTVVLEVKFNRGYLFMLRSLKIKNIDFKVDVDLPARYDPFFLLDTLKKVKKKLKEEGYFEGDAFLDVSFHKEGKTIYADAVIEAKKGERYKNGIVFFYGTWHLNPVMLEKNMSTDRFYSKEEFDNELDFLYYTHIFDAINPYVEIDRQEKQVNRIFVLHEDKRGSFQGLIGYSSEQKLKLSAAVRLKNLFSYGFETSAYVEKTDLGFFYKFTFGNRLLPKRTGVFGSYLKTYQYHSIYDLKLYGYEMKVSRKPNKWIKQELTLSYLKNTLLNQTVYPDSFFNTLKLSFAVLDDHRKPKTNPKGGYHITALVEREFKDIKFFKTYLSGRYYIPMGFLTFSQKITAGYIFKSLNSLPPSERFFLGGVSNFRGFGYEKVAGKYGTGGNSLLLFNNEVRYPLFTRFNLYGFSFVDMGNVYVDFTDLKGLYMRKTAGTGVYVPTPVGSFLFDVAFKLDRKTGEDRYRLEFSINTLF